MNIPFALPMRVLVAWGVAVLLGWAASLAQAQTLSTPAYDYYATGGVDTRGVAVDVTVPAPSQQVIVLEGGDADVKEAFAWMIARAGGGNFLVLRASGADGYQDWIYRQIGGVASVETLVTKTAEAASDPFVLARIAMADAIFIAGGDQWDYVRDWKDTPLARAVQQAVAQRRVPIGGTSAGMMILGEFVFTARLGTVTSAQALSSIDDPRVDLARDVVELPTLGNTVVDSHIVKRDRMGRLVAFMARTVLDGDTRLSQVRAVGVEAKTALLIEGPLARVVGPGAAYFLRPLGAAPVRCGTALTFRNVQVQRMDAKAQVFDVSGWASAGAAMASYDVSAECGVMTSSQGGNKLY